MKSRPFNTIEEAVKAGNKLKAFRSGGGLRVLYMWDMDDESKKSLYYGESYNMKEALRVLEDDVKAGGREYKEVYGVIEQHYLTGESWKGEDLLDLWIVGGNNLEAEWVDDFQGKEHFEAFLTGLEHQKQPLEITRKGAAGKTIYWHFNGSSVIRCTTQHTFANDAKGSTTRIIQNPNNEDVSSILSVGFVGEGETLQEAFDSAIEQQQQFSKTGQKYTIIGNYKSYLRHCKSQLKKLNSKPSKFRK